MICVPEQALGSLFCLELLWQNSTCMSHGHSAASSESLSKGILLSTPPSHYNLHEIHQPLCEDAINCRSVGKSEIIESCQGGKYMDQTLDQIALLPLQSSKKRFLVEFTLTRNSLKANSQSYEAQASSECLLSIISTIALQMYV